MRELTHTHTRALTHTHTGKNVKHKIISIFSVFQFGELKMAINVVTFVID